MSEIFDTLISPIANEMLKRAEMPKNEQIAKHRKDIFLNELRSFQFEHDINGQVIVKDHNGFEVTDSHGWPVTVNEVIKSTFDKYFEVSKWPLTEDEYWRELRHPAITPQRRRELVNYWEGRK